MLSLLIFVPVITTSFLLGKALIWLIPSSCSILLSTLLLQWLHVIPSTLYVFVVSKGAAIRHSKLVNVFVPAIGE